MQFVTVTVSGAAPRSFFSEAPGSAAIQTAINNIFQSDGFTLQSLKVTAGETGLFSGANPYSATVTLAANDADDPGVVAAVIGQEIGKALGQPVDTIGAPTTSASPTAPDAAPPSFLAQLQPTLVILAVLGVLALVILHKAEAGV